MADHSEILERLVAEDLISAECLLREALARDPRDLAATCLFASILRKSARASEAVGLLQGALQTSPADLQVMRELARAQRDNEQFLAAAATFKAYAHLDATGRAESLKEAASCLFRAGKHDECEKLLVEIGVLPEGVALTPDAVMAARHQGRLNDPQVVAILTVMAKADSTEARTLLKLALWETGSEAKRLGAVYDLPSLLLSMGRVEEAVRVYQKAVERGLPVGDFRPKSHVSSLAAADAKLAERFFHQSRDKFNANLMRKETASGWMWAPAVDAWHGVNLRGAVLGVPAEVNFEVQAYPPVEGQAWTAAATMTGEEGGLSFWSGAIDRLLAGQSYSIRMFADGQPSAAIIFKAHVVDPDAVITSAGDNIGTDTAVFAGRTAPVSIGARYRFEYGSTPAGLDQATAWKVVPPPRTGRAYRRVDRQVGEWHPTCVNPAWVHPDESGGFRLRSSGLLIGAPFAKDRNQLNGIGAHEMPLGLRWSQPRPSAASPPEPALWPIGGGVQDLRDAEISFTMCGHDLVQNGSALHFWISHFGADEIGPFTSQWALTSTPFPDDVLEGSAPQRVSVVLPNNPRAWTYTGNNPQEQGERAKRYRRLPLDHSLREHNAFTVLIFAFGDVCRPPTGGLIFYDAEVLYRDTSVLSPSAGAELVKFPASRADPHALSGGTCGHDSQLWTSELSPAFPLEFEWTLRQPVSPTHFQICQHPYWPAREVEIIAGNSSIRRRIWRGVLPEGRPDRSEPSETLVYLDDGSPVTTVILRILSGYHPERCGLDAFQFYGSGAAFISDGRPITLSAEVAGLAPGTTVNYRLVLEDGGEQIAGDVVSISLPATQAPIIESASPLVRARNPACYAVRANAMGLETELWGELRQADGRMFAGRRISLGSQPTGRHIYYVPEQIPDAPGEFSLHVRNVAGEATLRAPWPCR